MKSKDFKSLKYIGEKKKYEKFKELKFKSKKTMAEMMGVTERTIDMWIENEDVQVEKVKSVEDVMERLIKKIGKLSRKFDNFNLINKIDDKNTNNGYNQQTKSPTREERKDEKCISSDIQSNE